MAERCPKATPDVESVVQESRKTGRSTRRTRCDCCSTSIPCRNHRPKHQQCIKTGPPVGRPRLASCSCTASRLVGSATAVGVQAHHPSTKKGRNTASTQRCSPRSCWIHTRQQRLRRGTAQGWKGNTGPSRKLMGSTGHTESHSPRYRNTRCKRLGFGTFWSSSSTLLRPLRQDTHRKERRNYLDSCSRCMEGNACCRWPCGGAAQRTFPVRLMQSTLHVRLWHPERPEPAATTTTAIQSLNGAWL